MNKHEPTRAENHVMRAGGGSERAFEALYTAHYQAIAGYVRRRVAAHEADDVIAQIFAVAWHRFDRVPAPPGDRLWLFGVARNSVAEQWRSERRRLHLQARLSQDAMITASAVWMPGSLSEPVRAALCALRPADREALQLVLWDELSHAEAAALLGCSPNAFELRYRRARQAVRDTVVAMQSATQTGRECLISVPQKRGPIRHGH
jgi:RNA polymerase sigma-70 factor, ECF subfamily